MVWVQAGGGDLGDGNGHDGDLVAVANGKAELVERG